MNIKNESVLKNKNALLSFVFMIANNIIWILCLIKPKLIYKLVRWVPNGVHNHIIQSINLTLPSDLSAYQFFLLIFLFLSAFLMIVSTILFIFSLFAKNLDLIKNAMWINILSVLLIFLAWPMAGNRFCFLTIFLIFSIFFSWRAISHRGKA